VPQKSRQHAQSSVAGVMVGKLDLKNCNSCCESINEKAIKCQYCGTSQIFYRWVNLLILFGGSFLTVSSIVLIALSVSDVFIDKGLKSELLQVDDDMIMFAISNPSSAPKYIYGISGNYLSDVSSTVVTSKLKKILTQMIRKPVLIEPKKSILYKVDITKESKNIPPMPSVIKHVILSVNNMESDEKLNMFDNSDCSIWLVVKEQNIHAIEHKYRCINSQVAHNKALQGD
jgi:hypothetical protein